MIVFLKAQLSSLISTSVDFIVTIALVELFRINYIIAATNGAIAGAITNFTINKFWTFKQEGTEFKMEGLKYAFVWIGSIALNVIGSNLLIKKTNIHYVLAKIIASITVGVTFNYLLQKYYVFNNVNKTHKK